MTRRKMRNPNPATHAHVQSGSNGSTRRNGAATPQRTPAPAAPAEVGMSAVSRYNQNMRILRRRDPTIISFFDQFPHVCVYKTFNSNKKWEKKGYEGAMFFFEREAEPRYGFYILNRTGTDDYIQYMMPTDQLDAVNEELVSYESQTPYEPSVIRHPEFESEFDGDIAKMIGLWTVPLDGRDSLAVVLHRLLLCIKEGRPYPQQHRYDPERIARMTYLSSSHDEDDGRREEEDSGSEGYEDANESIDMNAASQTRATVSFTNIPTSQTGSSELDQLFAKLGPTSSLASIPPTQHIAQPSLPTVTTANSILEMLTRGGNKPTSAQPSTEQPLHGIALLNSMFASVSNVTLSQAQTVPQTNDIQDNRTQPNLAQFRFPSQSSGASSSTPTVKPTTISPPDNMEILSPKPSSAALPQILTADVIHELMGLSSSSRSASCISTSTSEQSRSADSHSQMPFSYAQGQGLTRQRTPSSAGAPRSKERGYIADRGEDDGGLSEASTGVEVEVRGAGLGSNTRAPGTQTLSARLSFLSATSTGSAGSLKGDATPRARVERGLEPAALGSAFLAHKPARLDVSQHVSETASTISRPANIRKADAPTAPSGARVPFQAGSELWPDDARQVDGEGAGGTESEGVVELDFSEIKVLDDPKAFDAKGIGRGKEKGKGKAEAGPKAREKSSTPQANGSTTSQSSLNRQRARPTKREREREKERLKDQSLPASESVLVSVSSVATTTFTSKESTQAKSTPRKQTGLPSNGCGVAPDLARDVLLGELASSGSLKVGASGSGRSSAGPAMEKNAFVREILTLIHTNKSFVDRLYQGYLNMA